MALDRRLQVAPGGYVGEEALEPLSVADWIRWIEARKQSYDPYTGQVIDTAVDMRLSVVRESVVRLQSDTTVQRAAAALSAVVRQHLTSVSVGGASPNNQATDAAFLAYLIDLMRAIPREVLAKSGDFGVTLTHLADLAVGECLGALPAEDAGPLRASALRALGRLGPALSTAQLQTFASDRYLASACIEVLAFWPDVDVAPIIASAYCAIARHGAPHQLSDLLSGLDRAGGFGRSLRSSVLLDAEALLPAALRATFEEEPFVRQALQEASTIRRIRAGHTHFRSITKKYVDGWDKKFVKPFSERLIATVRSEFGITIDIRRDPHFSTTDYLAFSAVSAESNVLFTFPIFQTEARDRIITVVPFGIVREFVLIYPTGADRDVDLNAGSLANGPIEAALRQKSWSYVTLDGTASQEELRAVEDKYAVDARTEAYNRPEEVGERIANKALDDEPWVAIVDIGFAEQVKDGFFKNKSGLENAGIGFGQVKLRYRRPMVCGIAVGKDDLEWARMIHRVIQQILYEENNIIDPASELGCALRQAGIEPLAANSPNLEEVWAFPKEEFLPVALHPSEPAVPVNGTDTRH